MARLGTIENDVWKCGRCTVAHHIVRGRPAGLETPKHLCAECLTPFWEKRLRPQDTYALFVDAQDVRE